MLNKIKVYNRKSGQEIQKFLLDYGHNHNENAIHLSVVIESKITENVSENQCLQSVLQKTDPLGKFKQEMEGWWFCEQYVVVEHNTDIKCEYYNYIEEQYVIGDHRGKNQIVIDIRCSEVLIDNGSCIPKYLKRWNLEEPSFNFGDGQFTVNELDKLQAEIDLQKAKWKEILFTKVNPNYIAFQKFVNDLGMNIEHGTEYQFSYQSIGEDKYIKLLEIIN